MADNDVRPTATITTGATITGGTASRETEPEREHDHEHEHEPEHEPEHERRVLVVSRPIRPADASALRRHFERLSPQTRYRRFFSPMTKLDGRLLAFLVQVDHDDREALVALVRDGRGRDEIIAVARYDRCAPDRTSAEVAVVVEDAWQGEGVGRYLMQRLGDLAMARGIARFTADVLPGNDAPVKLARAVAPMVEVSFVDGRTHLVIPLLPLRADRESARSRPEPGSRRPA